MPQAVEVSTLNPCLDRELLAGEIERWLGRDSIDARIRIRVGEAERVPFFSIALAGQPRLTRAFPSPPRDCDDQRRAIGLSIALAVDALSEGRHGPPPPLKWLLGIDGAVTTRLPASPGIGGSIAASLAVLPWFRPTLGAFFAASTDQDLGRDLPVRFETRILAMRAEACFVAHPGATLRLALAACAGTFLGALTTVAAGLPDARTETELWAPLSTALELHVRLTGAFGLHVGGDALFPLRRTQVEVADSNGKIAAERAFPRAIVLVRFGPTIFF